MMKTLGRLMVPVLIAGLMVTGALAAGGSSAPKASPLPEAEKSPEQEASEYYNRGLSSRNRAWKLEKKIAEVDSDGQRTKLEQKLERAWENAIENFTRATERSPRMHQAYSSLGYAYRKTGRYERSLAAYDEALALAPDYGEAIEYRAEAYLGLGRVEEAKQAYVKLFGSDRKLAGELLEAMRSWVDTRRTEPAGIDAGTLDAFGRWVEEREEIARQTASFRSTQERRSSW